MSQETSASAEKKALLEAFDTVLKSQAEAREAERAATEARLRRRGVSRVLIVVCATIIVYVSVYLYVERPDWVFPAPPAPESVAVREASLRISLANAAQHIERYRLQTGQLPVTLAQAGAHGAGMRYDRTATGYRLQAENEGVQVTFNSGESIVRFIGKSFDVISKRNQ
jgi:hypothetical protein